jgi:hypothetical protein
MKQKDSRETTNKLAPPKSSTRPSSANSNPYQVGTSGEFHANTLNFDFGDSNSKKRKAAEADFNMNLKTFEQHVRTNSKSSGEINHQGKFDAIDDFKYHQMRVKQEEEMLHEQLLAYNASRLANQNRSQQQQPVQKKMASSQNLTPISSSSSVSASSSMNPHQHHHQSSGMKINSNNSNMNKKLTIPTVGLPSSHSHLQQALSTSSVIPAAKKMKISPNSSAHSSRIERTHVEGGGGEEAASTSSQMQIFGTAVTEVVSNQLWICPSCNRHDDSAPMIGCDSCDDWYHW